MVSTYVCTTTAKRWVGGGINYSVDERTKNRTRRLRRYEYGTAKELEGALWSTIRVDGLFRPRIVWARGCARVYVRMVWQRNITGGGDRKATG